MTVGYIQTIVARAADLIATLTPCLRA